MTTAETGVRARLSVVVGSLELAALAVLLLFFKLRVLPDRLEILLILVLPVSFGLHVTEEFIFPGGFIAWDNLFRPRFAGTPGSYYVKVNAIPGMASLLMVLGAFDYAGHYSPSGIRSWLVFLTFMAWNAFFHLRGAIHTRQYSPGMATGLGLFVPLAIVSYVHLLRSGAVDGPSAVLCVAMALTIQPILNFIKSHGLAKHA